MEAKKRRNKSGDTKKFLMANDANYGPLNRNFAKCLRDNFMRKALLPLKFVGSNSSFFCITKRKDSSHGLVVHCLILFSMFRIVSHFACPATE